MAVEWPALAPVAPEEQLILGMYMYMYIHVLSNTYCIPDNTYMHMCTYIESLCKQEVVIRACVYLHYMYVHVFTYILIPTLCIVRTGMYTLHMCLRTYFMYISTCNVYVP